MRPSWSTYGLTRAIRAPSPYHPTVLRLLVFLPLLSFGCAGRQKPTSNAALLVLRGRGGQELSFDRFVAELNSARAICLGEVHDSPHHHELQRHLLRALVGRRGKGASDGALGMEMFQQPFQGVLDDFAQGRIDEDTMLERTGWVTRWRYPFAGYRPVVRVALATGMQIVALNAPTELVGKIARQGLSALTPDERAHMPELVLGDTEHRAFFDAATQSHPAPSGNRDDLYAAQVTWDETMAQAATEWLASSARRHIVILAGGGHCVDSAIPGRMRRRGVRAVVSVMPVAGRGAIADLLATRRYDYLVVLRETVAIR